jgi:hypothetical protein
VGGLLWLSSSGPRQVIDPLSLSFTTGNGVKITLSSKTVVEIK